MSRPCKKSLGSKLPARAGDFGELFLEIKTFIFDLQLDGARLAALGASATSLQASRPSLGACFSLLCSL